MAITTEQVRELREKTGISVMQCKKALEEAGGDAEKALIILEKNSKAQAAKKNERQVKAGTVASYIHAGGSVGSMVILSSETDFVAGNDEFKALAREIAMQIAATSPQYISLDEINEEDKKKVEEVCLKEIGDKPDNIKKQVLESKIRAFYAEKTLLEQPFIKDNSVTIRELIERAIHKFGEKIEVSKMARFSVGR